MEQPPRVQQRKRSCNVAQIQARLLERQRRCLTHVLPFEQLHRVVSAAVVDAEVEDANDARMVQTGEHVVLALECLDRMRISRFLWFDTLQRSRLADYSIEHAIDDAHPAGRELFLGDVAGARALAGRPRLLARRRAAGA